MTLDELIPWVQEVPASLPEPMREMAGSICRQFLHTAKRLMDLGLGYLSLDRAGSTLSTGERQRATAGPGGAEPDHWGPLRVGRAFHRTAPLQCGRPAGRGGGSDRPRQLGGMVDHDVRVLKAADWIIEMGPGAGGIRRPGTGPGNGGTGGPGSGIPDCRVPEWP